jgi:hypothetical protein
MSGEVKFVNAVDGGADARGSWKMSLGETVRVEDEVTDGSFIAVKAVESEKSQDIPLA